MEAIFHYAYAITAVNYIQLPKNSINFVKIWDIDYESNNTTLHQCKLINPQIATRQDIVNMIELKYPTRIITAINIDGINESIIENEVIFKHSGQIFPEVILDIKYGKNYIKTKRDNNIEDNLGDLPCIKVNKKNIIF